MLQNYDISIQDFLKLTNAGLRVANFVQVKNAIIERYKSVYGKDIDLSTASADGVFVNDLALIVNNILQTVSSMYANLDVNSASGEHLDILCRLSNITRRQRTNSTASITVTNLDSNSQVTLNSYEKFFDIVGTQWTATNPSPIVIPSNGTVSLTVVCDELGEVLAPAGSINQTVDASLNVLVVQSEDAQRGQDVETDSELRERRSQSNGSEGTTVLESLVGSLRTIAGVIDCKIYNNPSSDSAVLSEDGTSQVGHSIYVIIRKDSSIEISDETIGQIINNKLTPGVWSTESADSTTSKSYLVPSTIAGTDAVSSRAIYWKQCKPVSTTSIQIKINVNEYFNADASNQSSWTENSEFAEIAQAVMKYLNALRIGSNVTMFDISSEVLYSTFRGIKTFDLLGISFSNNLSSLTNSDNYYDYSSFTVTHNNSDNSYTIEIQ